MSASAPLPHPNSESAIDSAADPISERRLAIDALDRAIVNLAARINASTYELLVLIREFDERAGWLKWGLHSCSQWLHWRCDLSPGAARERVRVAHALKALPGIALEFSKGRLSYSKVRALTRVATPVNEGLLLDFALQSTAMRVEERCRQMRNSHADAQALANRIHAARGLRVWRDPEHGTVTLSVELSPEAGELVCQALDKAVEAQAQPGPEFEAVSWSAQQADALVAMAKRYLSAGAGESGGSAERYQVVVHIDETALAGGEGRSDLPVESVKRLACDASVVTMSDAVDGEPLNVGRRQRTVPAALRRALWARDKGCSFPGCSHRRWVDAHHIRHWADGGETSLANTMLLCSAHHRLVHEGGYVIRRDDRGRWYFQRPDGRAVPAYGYRPEDMVDEAGEKGIDDGEDHFAAGVPAGTPGSGHAFPGLKEHGEAAGPCEAAH
jgi:HPt (histidine-containing phosphotransfer) domain-containing protein